MMEINCSYSILSALVENPAASIISSTYDTAKFYYEMKVMIGLCVPIYYLTTTQPPPPHRFSLRKKSYLQTLVWRINPAGHLQHLFNPNLT